MRSIKDLVTRGPDDKEEEQEDDDTKGKEFEDEIDDLYNPKG